MAPIRAYMLPAFAAVAAVRAANIEDFMPGCAPECINEAINTHSTCEPGDGECLCADIYSLKRHAEDCLESSCSDAEYGEAMLGYDEFCAAVEDGPEDPTTSTSVPPPETTETSAPPPPETTTVSVPEEPTTVPEEPTSTNSYTSISVPAPTHSGTETFPSFSPVPIPTVSVPTNGTVIPSPTESGGDGEPAPEPTESGGDGDQPPADPTTTETPPPADAGANLGVSFGVLAGGALLATFFGF